MSSLAALADELICWRTGKARSEVDVPNPVVLASGEDIFPKGEFKMGDDFAGCRQSSRTADKVRRRIIVELSLWA
ncbi:MULTISPECIES: hypothetical protein [Sphingobium]|jgi:hypothetical protein|uniref:Uncharacterized protein n=1 Tax=Sphingobium limneticum TaxID=1007511 RepID=A0A5J5HZ90_9SPHN|nr:MULTISPECIES: hypothetical protein [Sphingobium]KAA9014944.1 hypothetical protein F4U96_14880 [Sphingobium limneticum]KAA9017361.1 hypothetical protein F4U94_09115 [Sphingobium limneticum]KAA9027869.1 hypothetical protein F4U95_15005 [Sphingobium limneticum]